MVVIVFAHTFANTVPSAAFGASSFSAAAASPAPSAVPVAQVVTNARHDVLVQRIVSSYEVSPAFAARIVRAAHSIAEREHVDPVLLLALVGVESNFNPLAHNSSGAVGLTQTIAKWHPEKVALLKLQGKSLSDPEANLETGARILAEYTRQLHGNRILALQQYNGSLKDPRHRYAGRVMAVYNRLTVGLPAISAGVEKPTGVVVAVVAKSDDI
jgi:soluble lytic murein transglycosylase-like protein